MIAPATRARGEALLAALSDGATRVLPPILLQAGPLLDLYGEDIRARAFVTQDPLRGEAMLRPDFTVPVVQAHMAARAGAARYVYSGEVFRRQEDDEARPREYLQVGLERLGDPDPAEADAETFAAFAAALAPWAPRAETGDLGLVIAAVAALDTTERRRAALRRHVWRPRRFRRLLDRFTGRAPRAATGAAAGAPTIGLRTAEEVAARHAALAEDAATPPIARAQAQAVEALLDLDLPMRSALPRLRDVAVDLPGLAPDVERGPGAGGRAVGPRRRRGRPVLRAGPRPHCDGILRRVHLHLRRGRVRRGDRRALRRADRGAGARARRSGRRRRDPAGPAGGIAVIRLGVPSKGRLMERTFDWFAHRGLTLTRTGSEREYAGAVEGAEMALVLLSASEVPRELAAGRLHLGVTGSDMVRETLVNWPMRVEALAPMGFGQADLVLAVPAAWTDCDTLDDLDAVAHAFRAAHGHRLRIATKYHRLVAAFLRDAQVADYALVDSQGATEGTVLNGTAEAIADITSTGETLRANHLKVLADGLIHASQATLFRSHAAEWSDAETAEMHRLRAVLT